MELHRAVTYGFGRHGLGIGACIGACIAAMLVTSPASATFSITAADSVSGAVGGAGASCVPYEVILIYGEAPGYGALNAQAWVHEAGRDRGVDLLAGGASASAVIEALCDEQTDPLAPRMQYGVATRSGESAACTGPEALPFAGHRTGNAGSTWFAVQGNVLTSARVLDQAVASLEVQGCDLPERLMLGMEAAAQNGEGDSRCTPDGLPASSAYLAVAFADGSHLRISVPDVSPEDPLVQLRSELDAWRTTHPCPAIENDAGSPPDAAPPTGDEVETGGCAVVPAPPLGFESAAALIAAWLARVARRRQRDPRRG